MVLPRVVKAKTSRGKRVLARKEAKLIENDKQTLFLKGGNTSQNVSMLLKELYSFKKLNSTMYKRKNITRPFEDESGIEYFLHKTDSSLFVFGSHSKKRPDNFILGRLYDDHILDMIELGATNIKSVAEFAAKTCPLGTKPCLAFAGEAFDVSPNFIRLKSLLIDIFRGPSVNKVRLQGLEHILHFTALDDKVYFRSYRIVLNKSGTKNPRVELEEMGPSVDFVLRRTKLASDDLFKKASKVPYAVKKRKIKNISHDPFGTKQGRIHMQKQELNKLQTRKMKGLKKSSIDEESQNVENDDSQNMENIETDKTEDKMVE